MTLYQFSWFGFKISVLGLSAGVTVLFIYVGLLIISKRYSGAIQNTKIADLIISVGIFTLIVSRGVYVVFNWEYYTLESKIPSELFKIWHGGFSPTGAAIGFLISYWLITYILNIKSTFLLDQLSPILMISLFILGAGNYFNQKIREETSKFFIEKGNVEIMDIFNNHTILENPEILYESWAYLLAGLVLLKLINREFPKGFIFNCTLILYSVIRFIFSNVSPSMNTWEFYATHLISILFFSIALALIIGMRLFIRVGKEYQEKFGEKQRSIFEEV